MRSKEIKSIDVLIMEDDVFYNNLLAKKISSLNYKSDIKSRFTISVKQFSKPSDFLQVIESKENANNPTIAFIDYYLGYGINGMHLVYLLEEMNKNIQIILMSQSESIIKEKHISPSENNSLIKIQKHEYTPDVCCAIIENHVQNLS